MITKQPVLGTAGLRVTDWLRERSLRMRLAERFDVREVASLDRRDYLIVASPASGDRLTLLPAD